MCNNPCNQGDISCAGGIVSTCTMVDGCLEFAKTSTCPSGICQDEMTCATAPNCGSFTCQDTCTATMTIKPGCGCPGSGTCVASEDSSDCASGNTISGANAITEYEVASMRSLHADRPHALRRHTEPVHLPDQHETERHQPHARQRPRVLLHLLDLAHRLERERVLVDQRV